MAGSLPEHAFTSGFAQGQHQNVYPSTLTSHCPHHTRSQPNPLSLATTQQPQSAPSLTASAAPDTRTPVQASTTEPPVKRKRGRPRKHALPQAPRVPSPNPALSLGRAALAQIVASVRQGRAASNGQDGQLSRLRPRPSAAARSTATEDVTDSPAAAPQATILASYHHPTVLDSQTPNPLPAVEYSQRHVASTPAVRAELPATAGGPAHTRIHVGFRPVAPPPLRPFIPTTAATQTSSQFSTATPLHKAATGSALVASQDPLHFSTIQSSPQFSANDATNMPATADAPVATPAPFHFPAASQFPIRFPAHVPASARQSREQEECRLAARPDAVQAPIAAGVYHQEGHEVAAIRCRAYEDRVARDLAVAYQTHNTWLHDQHPRRHPRSTITPRGDSYPLTYEHNTSTDEMTVQPHRPPANHPPFPFYVYWGRDLNEGPVLPTMSISGGPNVPCFERSTDGNRADVGFGPGIRVAEAFRGIWERYGGEDTEDVVGLDRKAQ